MVVIHKRLAFHTELEVGCRLGLPGASEVTGLGGEVHASSNSHPHHPLRRRPHQTTPPGTSARVNLVASCNVKGDGSDLARAAGAGLGGRAGLGRVQAREGGKIRGRRTPSSHGPHEESRKHERGELRRVRCTRPERDRRERSWSRSGLAVANQGMSSRGGGSERGGSSREWGTERRGQEDSPRLRFRGTQIPPN